MTPTKRGWGCVLNQLNQKKYVRWGFLSLIVGVLAGVSSSVFLFLLDWATKTRLENVGLIWFLPIGGFIVGWVYHHHGNEATRGNNLVIDEIHDPKKIIPFRMAPLVLFGTIITHLFGGSAGREGTAVQMGASLADRLTVFFKVEPEERKLLLISGMGAGFGSAIGAPLAGAIFGMEVLSIGKLKFFALFECVVASYTAFYISHLLKAPHSVYPAISIPQISIETLGSVLIAGIIFGLTAIAFIRMTHLVEKVQNKISYAPLRPFLGGALIILLYHLEGTYRFAGLGIGEIQKAILNPSSFTDPSLKAVFTSLTLGSGFKGGEFIPLVYIGTTLGSFLSNWLPISCGVLGAVGFASLFAGAANTPLACSVMVMELFGFGIAPYALIGCYVSYYFSGHHGIYKSQKIHKKKYQRLWLLVSWLGSLPIKLMSNTERK